jgi:small-conductance mechanosensitive channel
MKLRFIFLCLLIQATTVNNLHAMWGNVLWRPIGSGNIAGVNKYLALLVPVIVAMILERLFDPYLPCFLQFDGTKTVLLERISDKLTKTEALLDEVLWNTPNITQDFNNLRKELQKLRQGDPIDPIYPIVSSIVKSIDGLYQKILQKDNSIQELHEEHKNYDQCALNHERILGKANATLAAVNTKLNDTDSQLVGCEKKYDDLSQEIVRTRGELTECKTNATHMSMWQEECKRVDRELKNTTNDLAVCNKRLDSMGWDKVRDFGMGAAITAIIIGLLMMVMKRTSSSIPASDQLRIIGAKAAS